MLGTAPAAAGNWTLGGRFLERIEADTNLRLEDDGEALYGSTTTVTLDFGYETPRTEWFLGSGLSLRAFAGPGDTDGLNGLSDPRITGGVTHRGDDRSLGADFGFVRRPVGFTQVDETGRTDGEATETAASLGGFWSRELDARNSLSLRADVSVRRFSDDDDELTPSTSYGVTGRWTRRLDARTAAGASLGVTLFEQDGDPTDTDSTVVRAGVSLDRRVSPRSGFSLDLGLSRATVEETTDLGPVTLTEERSSLGFSGSAGFDWRGPRTAFGFTASQALESSADGGLDQTSRLAASLRRSLTRRASAGLVADASRRVAEDDDDDEVVWFLSVGPRLDIDLTRDWSAGMGVRLRLREDDDGTANAAGVFFELSRPFVLNR